MKVLKFYEIFMKTRPVWTGFKIAVRHKLQQPTAAQLTHNKTKLYAAYKKAIVHNIALL